MLGLDSQTRAQYLQISNTVKRAFTTTTNKQNVPKDTIQLLCFRPPYADTPNQTADRSYDYYEQTCFSSSGVWGIISELRLRRALYDQVLKRYI